MCGIAALFGEFPKGLTKKMIELVRHRGPDGDSYAFFPRAELGHARLAIIDLSEGGRQPFSDPSGRYFLTYNGEIYNYLELKKELEALGHHFTSSSDSEVLLYAFIEWKEGALSRLNGMFAAVIYDKELERYVAFRDRFGVKPLYYKETAEGIAFASEIKQFRVLPGWRARFNQPRGEEFLSYGLLDHTDETLFEGVYQLRGGEIVEGPPFTKKRWYHPKIEPYKKSFQEAKEEFRFLLSDAIKLRLRSDVAVGAALSGGLDSSSIVALAKKPLHTFSVLSKEEESYIEEMKRAFSLKNSALYPSGEALKEMLWIQDEPFLTASPCAQWSLFKKVKEEGVTVLLDGQGADEPLGGYTHFLSKHLRDLSFSRNFSLLARELLHAPLKSVIRAATPPSWIDHYQKRRSPFYPTCAPLFSEGRSFQQATEEELLKAPLPMLLHLEDRNSMAHSVEARNPFLDVRLVEMMLSLPSTYKQREGFSKAVLREAMKGILPDAVRLRRDKIGFAAAETIVSKALIDEGVNYAREVVPLAAFIPPSYLFRTAIFGHWVNCFL